jgi:hypothetical protein
MTLKSRLTLDWLTCFAQRFPPLNVERRDLVEGSIRDRVEEVLEQQWFRRADSEQPERGGAPKTRDSRTRLDGACARAVG